MRQRKKTTLQNAASRHSGGYDDDEEKETEQLALADDAGRQQRLGIGQKLRLQASQDNEDFALHFQSSLVVWSSPVIHSSHWQTSLNTFSVPLGKNRTNTLGITQMTNYFPLFLDKTLSRRPHFKQDHIAETVLKHFLQQSQKGSHSLAIISVHGRSSLDKQIASYAPEETEFIRITHELHNFLSKPRFDVIFFSSPELGYDESKLYENLSYCRMLLKPGGSIWFLVETTRHTGFLQRVTWKKSMEAGWLTRTGFTELHRKKIGREIVFLCGSRPKGHF